MASHLPIYTRWTLRQRGSLPTTGTLLTRLRSELTDPTLIVLPLVAAAFCLLRWLHLIAR